jgi:hypothetical protein
MNATHLQMTAFAQGTSRPWLQAQGVEVGAVGGIEIFDAIATPLQENTRVTPTDAVVRQRNIWRKTAGGIVVSTTNDGLFVQWEKSADEGSAQYFQTRRY